MDDEGALVRRLREGDESAFAAVVRQYHPALIRLATALVGSRAVADEVVQDTWLSVVRGIEHFEERSTFKTWLFHILINRARSTAGHERRCAPLGDDRLAERFDAAGEWSAPPAPWTDEVDERVVAERVGHRLRELIDELPGIQRQVVLLRDVEGIAAHEVADLLGLTAGHERVLLHRARTRVRAALEAELGTA